MSSLKKQTVSSVKWLVGSSFLQKAISFGATIILARILSPSVFGLFTLAFVAIDSLGLFKSLGFDSALIRKKDNIEKAANTAFFIIPLLGFTLFLILNISAPVIGKSLNNQEIVGVIRILGIIFIFSCLGKVPAAMLEKSMQFKKVSIIEISSAILYSVSAITLALLGFGVWSLVVAYIIKTLNQNILFWIFSKWHPKFEFDKDIALEMFHFGKFLFLGGVVLFLRMNLDNLFVGKLLGVEALGLYAVAFNIANFGSDYFGGKVHRVVFPAYSKIQGDKKDLKPASLKVLQHVSLLIIPFSIGIILLGADFLRLAYGSKWMGAARVLQILAFAGLFNTLPSGMNAVFLAFGKSRITFWIATLQVTIFLLFITPMAKLFGINGVAIVVSVSSLVAFVFTIAFVGKILSMNINDVWMSIKPALIPSIFMATTIIITKNILLLNSLFIPLRYNFIVLLPVAIVSYFIFLRLFHKKIVLNLKELLFL